MRDASRRTTSRAPTANSSSGYYAGEGAAFAEGGAVTTEWVTALNRSDFDRLLGELSTPEMRVENRSRSAFPNRSAAELRASFEDLGAMVASVRAWLSVAYWLSPTWCVARHEREAVGRDGERYAWTQLLVAEFRDGRIASIRQFELDDEEAAFAYADERVRASSSRLAVTNRASEVASHLFDACNSRDVDAAFATYADQFVYDDRRRLSGDPIDDRAGLRAAIERICEHYSEFEAHTLAVRGERLHLARSRRSDDAGNESTHLLLTELGDDSRIAYYGRFDEDDFEGAYRELERRYYAGEGAEFAEQGAFGTEWVMALNQGDFDRVFNELTHPFMRVENRSLSVFGDPSAAELRASFEELYSMVASARAWSSAIRWLSPTWGVARLEREAVGLDGEKYAWARLQVVEFRDGRLASMCRFEVDDEEAAFAYAEERVRAASSRLAMSNRVTEVSDRLVAAMNARDIEATIDAFSDQIVYDDRRRLNGDPIEDRDGLRAAFERIFEQYSVFESRTLAVRGQRVALWRSRWSDDSGNETDYLHVFELDDDWRTAYVGRFDEDDFESAYRELEQRYYAGEGAAFGEAGLTLANSVIAMNRGDLDQVFGELATPDASMENRSRSVFGDRSADEYRASIEELHAMVASVRVWWSAVCWLSPAWVVLRAEREAVGQDGEQYTWTKAYALEIRGGRPASSCEFELDDEDAAFAYAEERMQAASSRLAVSNRATEVAYRGMEAMQARDIEAQLSVYSDQFVYDDRRRLSGHPIENRAELRAAMERIHDQYSVFEASTLAVRGERLHLACSRWSDVAGNVTVQLHVQELGDDERIACEVRFDEDNFESAYRELERRYYAGEGSAHTEAGEVSTEVMIAMTQNDFGRRYNEFIVPELQIENRSRSPIPLRTATDLPASTEQLDTMVDSVRVWNSAVCWLSPTWLIERTEREAVGPDGQTYAWTYVVPTEIRDGRIVSMGMFDIEDEEAAFAYAEERMPAASSRLAVANRASKIVEAGWLAIRAHDVDGLVAFYSDRFEYDDRRRLSGDPIESTAAMRAAVERLLEQYPHFDWRTLTVRGTRLEMHSSRWWDDAGNQAAYLHVGEIGDDGRIIYDGRFDEDNFEGAYRELERRYYAGEGAAFAEAGALQTEFVTAMNRGDFDRIFGELTLPDLQVENRSLSAVQGSSATDLRAATEQLHAMVASVRVWNSAVCWLSPTRLVARHEREAIGQDGERYEWTSLLVGESRDGRLASMCVFDIENEERAFSYADERIRAAEDND